MADQKYSAGIEVVHELPTDLRSSSNVGTKAEPAGHLVGNGVDLAALQNVRRLKRTIVWLVVAVILLIVLVVVLGAVLGTKLHSKPTVVTQTSTFSLPATPTSSSTASPSAVRKNTAISATGWRSGSEFSIRLFYQGDDAYLRVVRFESSNSSWSAPSTIVQAKPGTPIAASSYDNSVFFGSSEVWNFNTREFKVVLSANSIY
jgi:hypothetical protein